MNKDLCKFKVGRLTAFLIGQIIFLPCAVLADTSNINGLIGLKMESGRYIPGKMVTIFTNTGTDKCNFN